MKLPSKVIASIFSLTFLSACLTGPSIETTPPGKAPTTIPEVVSLLDQICGASRPSFASSEQRMIDLGMKPAAKVDGKLLDLPLYVSTTKNVFTRVAKTKDGHKICWVGSEYPGDLVQLQEENMFQ